MNSSSNIDMKQAFDYLENINDVEPSVYLYSQTLNKLNVSKPDHEEEKKIILLDKMIKYAGDSQPGPGYYIDDLSKISMFKPPKVNEDKQCFGYTEKRFRKDKGSYCEESLGPGSFYKESSYLTKDNQIRLKKSLENKKQKSLNKHLNKDEQEILNFEVSSLSRLNKTATTFNDFYQPGPGDYNTTKDFFKKSHNSGTKYMFGIGEKRFPYLERGSKSKNKKNEIMKSLSIGGFNTNQIEEQNIMKNIPFKKLNRTFLNKTSRSKNKIKEKSRTSSLLVEDQLNFPSVGNYNVDKGIEYKLSKITHNPKNPFHSTSRRFSEDIESFVGPGSYYKNRGYRVNKNLSAFNYNDKRFKSNFENENVGPGSYIKTSYFDWNRKTFNVSFL